MELHHSKEKQTADLQTVITARLSDFVRELPAMIETVQFGRLHFTGDGYNALESARWFGDTPVPDRTLTDTKRVVVGGLQAYKGDGTLVLFSPSYSSGASFHVGSKEQREAGVRVRGVSI